MTEALRCDVLMWLQAGEGHTLFLAPGIIMLLNS